MPNLKVTLFFFFQYSKNEAQNFDEFNMHGLTITQQKKKKNQLLFLIFFFFFH